MWNYYTTTNNFNQVHIPVNDNKSNNCLEDRGCPELNSGDVAMVNNEENYVTMHPYNRLRYIPYYFKCNDFFISLIVLYLL